MTQSNHSCLGKEHRAVVGALGQRPALEHTEAGLACHIRNTNMINIVTKVPLPEISKLFTKKEKIGPREGLRAH